MKSITISLEERDYTSIDQMLGQLGQHEQRPGGGLLIFRRSFETVELYLQHCVEQQVRQARAMFPPPEVQAIEREIERLKQESGAVSLEVRRDV